MRKDRAAKTGTTEPLREEDVAPLGKGEEGQECWEGEGGRFQPPLQ